MSIGRQPLADTRIVIIRHAEKPEDGSGLTPAGEARAKAYVGYFKSFKIAGKPFKIDHIFAATDSKKSIRPRLTVTPLAAALGLKLDQRFSDKDGDALADELKSKSNGKNILVCWRHGKIPALLTALGADKAKLIPGPKWPDNVYDWAIELTYNHQGKLSSAVRVAEHLMPGDSK